MIEIKLGDLKTESYVEYKRMTAWLEANATSYTFNFKDSGKFLPTDVDISPPEAAVYFKLKWGK